MDTLHDRLAELADGAPTGGAPAAELWARGKRAHRVRVAGVAAALLVVGAVGTGIGVRHVDNDGSGPEPAGNPHITLPIEYPVGEELSDLGQTPGPLTAVWLAPREGSGALEAIGLVAQTQTFGTLPIHVSSEMYSQPDAYFALSPDGRRIAYHTPADELVVRDLVSGESYSPAFESFQPRRPDDASYTWVDATHLVGHVAPEGERLGSEADGWVWEPGTTPQRVDLMTYPGSVYLWANAGKDPWFQVLPHEEDPRQCLSLRDLGAGKTIPVLCDVVGVIGSKIALTHDGDRAVVALDVRGVEDPALRHVVAAAGGPLRVTFATDLIGEALDIEGGAS
jgi:hypothetical protein